MRKWKAFHANDHTQRTHENRRGCGRIDQVASEQQEDLYLERPTKSSESRKGLISHLHDLSMQTPVEVSGMPLTKSDDQGAGCGDYFLIAGSDETVSDSPCNEAGESCAG